MNIPAFPYEQHPIQIKKFEMSTSDKCKFNVVLPEGVHEARRGTHMNMQVIDNTMVFRLGDGLRSHHYIIIL